MELADIVSQESIIPCAKVASKRQLLQLLAEKAASLVGIDAQVIFDTLLNREQLGSTGLGNGIAIPHGKIKGLRGVTAVFARLAQPIEFDAVDDQPVDLVVMLLAPEGSGADHLKALSRVARLLPSPDPGANPVAGQRAVELPPGRPAVLVESIR